MIERVVETNIGFIGQILGQAFFRLPLGWPAIQQYCWLECELQCSSEAVFSSYCLLILGGELSNF